MIVQRFKKKHMKDLADILKARNAYVPTFEEMPETGFVARQVDGPIAASAFIRKCEGGYAQLDGIASNPNCSSEFRNWALDLVMKSCIQEAKRLGITQLIGFTCDDSTQMRSERLGFVQLPHRLMALNLNSKV